MENSSINVKGKSKPVLIQFLHHPDHRIQRHRHNTEQHDRHDQPIHLKYLAGVNDQISQSVPRRKEFPDHYPDQAQPDIDFHIAYYSGDRAGKYHFKKGVPPCSVQGIDEFDLFPVNSGEAGVQVHDTAEDCHGHTGNDDGRWGGAQPHDEQRRECGFRQAVQDDQIRLEYLGKFPAAPEENSGKEAEQCDKQETDNGFVQSDADVQENGAVSNHFPEAQSNLGRAAEDKRINDPCVCTNLPQDKKDYQDQ